MTLFWASKSAIAGELIPIPDLSRMLMQATSISSQFSGLRVPSGLYLLQSSSIPQASAVSQKASAASMKTFNSPFSILQWGGGAQSSYLPQASSMQDFWPFLLGYFFGNFAAFFREFLVPFLFLFIRGPVKLSFSCKLGPLFGGLFAPFIYYFYGSGRLCLR
jgi:hypothetical protein